MTFTDQQYDLDRSWELDLDTENEDADESDETDTEDIDQIDQAERDDTDPAAAAAQDVLGSGVSLEELAARPGSRWGDLASELIVAREERAAKAEKASLARQADELDGTVDVSDPVVQAMLRAQAEADLAAGNRMYGQYRKAELIGQYGEELGGGTWEREKAELAAGQAWFYGRDPLIESPVYQASLRASREAAGVAQVAYDFRQRERSMDDDARDAQEWIDQFVAARAAGIR